MATIGEMLFPRSTKLASLPPYHPRAVLGAASDVVSAPGRAYASLGRPTAESYSDAMARTGPTLAMPGAMYQGEGDEFADMVLRDPLLPAGVGISMAARGLGRIGAGLVEGFGNAAGAGAVQYSDDGSVSPIGMALAGGLSGIGRTMPKNSAQASMIDHPTFRKYGIDPGKGVTLYHGSPREFDRFDLSKAGSQRAMTEGWGAYFTADKNNAKAFGKNVIDLALSVDDLQRVIDIEAPLSAQTPFVRDALSGLAQSVPDPSDAMMRIQTMARDPMYKSYFRGEVGKSLWDYDKMRNLILSDEYIDTPVGRILKWQFLPQDISGSLIVKRAEGSMSGSSKRGNKWLNDHGIIGYSMPSRSDILAKNKNTVNAVIFDNGVLSRFGGTSSASAAAANPAQMFGHRLGAASKHAALREYLSDDRPQGDTHYTSRSRR